MLGDRGKQGHEDADPGHRRADDLVAPGVEHRVGVRVAIDDVGVARQGALGGRISSTYRSIKATG